MWTLSKYGVFSGPYFLTFGLNMEINSFFAPNSLKNGFWGRNFENLTPGSKSALPRYHVYQFLDKTNNFDFFSPNFPKYEFSGQNFKNLSPDLESAPPEYHVCQFLGETESSDFFSPNLLKNGLRVGNSEN